MKRRRKITSLFLIWQFLASGSVLAENCQAGLDHFADRQTPQSIHLRIYHDFLVVVEGRFGCGQGRQNFVVDTGTAPSIINTRLVQRLGLTAKASSTSTFGRMTATETAILAEIDLGPIRAFSLPVQIQDLSRLERDLGISIAAIIGLDVLSKTDFRLDFDKKRLTFGGTSEGGISVPVDTQAGIAVASVKLDGSPARMLVDTGSDRVVLLGQKSGKKNEPALRGASQGGLGTAGQAMRTQVLFRKDIAIGPERFKLRTVYVLPGNPDPQFDGLLGVRALGFRAISFSRTSAIMLLQK